MTSLGAKLERWLHPIWRRMTLGSDNDVNNAVIGALDNELSDSEKILLQTKVESSLATANGDWLDKWGYWFGQRRLDGWSDDEYRNRIVYHVTHGRNTIDSIRTAIANFLNINKDKIYIYEPFRDIFILNDSLLNSSKYLPSTYYRYAVIDIKISANIPDEVISIINLFRPAGVLWVLTHDINRFDANAQVFDMNTPKSIQRPAIDYKYFIGLVNKKNFLLTASQNEYAQIQNPFIYNSDSLLNSGSLLDGTLNTSKQYSIIGQSGFTVIPDTNDTLSVLSYEMEQPDSSEIKRLGLKDGFGHYFSTSLVKDNLISNSNDYIEPIKLDCNSGSPNLYLNSRTISDGYGIVGDPTVTVEPFDSTTNTWHIVAKHDTGAVIGIYLWGYGKGKFQDNSYWSYSADVKGTGNIYEFGIETGSKNPVVGTIGSEWSRISQTGRVDNDLNKSLVMYFDSTNSSIDVYIKLPKLEIGNTPTPWSPAPSEQTVSKSGSLVLPVVNINSNSSYMFSMISNASDDIANASLNLIIKDSSGNDISSVISNSISSGKQVLNIGLSTSVNFSSNGYAVLHYSGIDVSKSLYASLLCVKLVTGNLASNANSWSPNSNDKQDSHEINIDLDIKSYVNDNVQTLSSSVTSSDINSMFQNKRFQITSKLNDITTPSVTVSPYIFNYNANVFMSLDKFYVDNSGYKDYFVDFNDVTPFISSNGIMSFKLITEKYNNGLSIDYFGLGLYNTSDEVVLKANKYQSNLGLEFSQTYSSAVDKAIVGKSEVK